MAKRDMSSLQLRIISACILAPLALGALFLGGLYFTIFMGLAAAAMGFEWCNNSLSDRRPLFMVVMIGFVSAAVYLEYAEQILPSILVLVCGSVFLAALAALFRQPKDIVWAFLGPLLTGLPVVSLIALRGLADIGFAVTTGLFLVIWATDIGAYFSGKSIGGPKIAPVISPNKTWAGLIGGMVAAAIVAYLESQFLIEGVGSPIVIMTLGGLCAILAQVGDFTESAWKRHFKIKDASNLIPGHGGVLDRLDGILFTAPVLLALLLLMERN